MKTKITFPLIVLFSAITLFYSARTNAQVTLYGLTCYGGDSNVGTVFEIKPSGYYHTVASLRSQFAAWPYGSLLFARDSAFYASSYGGAYDDSCTIFKCSSTGAITTMIDLDTVWNQSDPKGNSLIQGMDGILYGMTTMGGNNGPYGDGLIFKMTLSGHYSAVHFFTDSIDGRFPYGSLIQTKDSMLWGMTSTGGAIGFGTIFKCTTSGVFTTVHSFNDTDGGQPFGDLLLANDGNFYGLTSFGGKYGDGVLFRLTTSGIYTKLVDFTGDTNGGEPLGSLIQATDGKLYGLTETGGIQEQEDSSSATYGTLFSCTLSGNLTTLVYFTGINGEYPMGTLIQASDGNLYGMTTYGGTNSLGNVFQYTLSGNLTTLISFDSTTGTMPEFGKLIEVDKLPSGLNALVNSTYANVFPNPNNGVFTIQTSAASARYSVLTVYNITGQQIKNEALKGNTSVIDLSAQPSGVYLYRLLGETGNLIGEGKLIIQK